MIKIFQAREELEFYSLSKIKALGADFNLLYGERSNGKSFAVKEECFKHFLETGGEMAIIRRYETEISKAKLERYFADTAKYVEKWSGGRYNEIYIYSGQIFVALNVDGKHTNAKRWGYAFALNLAQSYSSNSFPDIDHVILEEFISLDGTYLPNELFNFLHILSTIARRRNVVAYLIANSISRLSPYWREYGVDEFILTQEQGTIGLIERETDGGIQRVAVEYCANTKSRSRMFVNRRDEMINGGKWLTKQYPKLPFDISLAESLYTFIVEYNTALFMVQYISYDGNYCLYVTPKTSPIKPNTRVVSNRSSVDPFYSMGFRPINSKERAIFDLIKNGKVFYCDNMTGTEFNESIKNLSKLVIF